MPPPGQRRLSVVRATEYQEARRRRTGRPATTMGQRPDRESRLLKFLRSKYTDEEGDVLELFAHIEEHGIHVNTVAALTMLDYVEVVEDMEPNEDGVAPLEAKDGHRLRAMLRETLRKCAADAADTGEELPGRITFGFRRKGKKNSPGRDLEVAG